MSKINSVKFKDKKSFEKNKNKSNVLAVHEPFGIIIFKDDKEVTPDPSKVSQTNTVDASLDQISTGLAILIAHDYKEGLAYLKSANVKITDSFEFTKTFFVEIPDFIPFDSFYGSIMSTGKFISVEPDYIMPMQTTEEMVYAGHWHLPNMKCQEAWNILPAGVVKEVAVLDIACETNHEDLAGRISSTSWNCVTDGPDVNPVTEFEKHGTACSGVICANTGNGIGCKSISNNHLKVQFLHIGYNSSSTGGFQTSDTIITRAVNKAIANPDCVAMSMSWGSTGSGYPLFSNALNMARTTARNGKGIPLFASSGNSYQSDFTQLPASYPSVMAVGATTSTDVRANFSNYGPKLFAAAPGSGLYTVDRTGAAGYGPDSYRGFSGTSASCPAMAAVAGCVLVKNPDLTEVQVREVLKNACRKVGGYVYTNGRSAELGWGIIDMYAAVSIAGGTDPGEPTPTPGYNVYGTISSPASVQQGQLVSVTYSVILDKPLTEDKIVDVNIAFRRSDGTSLNFYTGNVTISAGQTSKSMNIPYTVPNSISGVCQFVMTVDPSNKLQENNENDNVAVTSINVTQIPTPGQTVDGEIKITGYEWLDATRVRIRYTFTNKGTATITSWKAVVGFDGNPTSTWNRTDVIAPGRSASFGSVFPSVLYGTLPNTFRIDVTQVNGAPDGNMSNNKSSILVSK
jgi:thermitase